MKIKLFYLLFIVLIFGTYGCSLLIPKHETKTEAEFHIDKKDCDQQAWEYTKSMRISDSDDAEANHHLNYSRKCLKQKGWRYFK